MPESFEELCQKLGLTLSLKKYSQFAALQKWCRENISEEIHYSGDIKEKYQQYSALAKDYLDNFQFYLKKNQSVEKTPEFTKAVMKYAIERGYERFIRTQPPIEKSILDNMDSYGTPLHMSATMGHLSITKRLLSDGADPRHKDLQGHSPLKDALCFPFFDPKMREQKEAIFRALLSKAPDLINERDKEGNTIIHHMASAGSIVLMKEALAKHPPLAWLANHKGEYPIHTAILHRKTQICAYLLRIKGMGAVVDARKRTALHYAANYGTPLMVELCCNAVPQNLFVKVLRQDPKETDFIESNENYYILSDTKFWFFDAFKRQLVHIILDEESLDKLKKCVTIKQSHEITNAEFASIKKITRHLAPNYFNARDIDDATPILLAASANNLATMKVLIRHRNCLRKQDIQGFTLFHHAVVNENEAMLRMIFANLPRRTLQPLLKKGDEKGRSLLFYAREVKNADIEDLILNQGVTKMSYRPYAF